MSLAVGSLETLVPGFLHHQITSEAIGCLDNDGSDAVAGNLLERGSKAGPAVDRIGTVHGGIVDPFDNAIAGAIGECLNGPALAGLAVFVLAHVGCGAGSCVTDCRLPLAFLLL
jgi:hypothetical protein